MSGMKDLFGDQPFRPLPAGYGPRHLPGWKEPTTSRDAALMAAKTAANVRALVRAAIAGGSPTLGMTPDEVAERLNMSVLTVRPRVTELSNAGEIERTGSRRMNRSGAMAACWRIKEST